MRQKKMWLTIYNLQNSQSPAYERADPTVSNRPSRFSHLLQKKKKFSRANTRQNLNHIISLKYTSSPSITLDVAERDSILKHYQGFNHQYCTPYLKFDAFRNHSWRNFLSLSPVRRLYSATSRDRMSHFYWWAMSSAVWSKVSSYTLSRCRKVGLIMGCP